MSDITRTDRDDAHPEWLGPLGGGQRGANAILDQEARGQLEMLVSTQLPAEIHGDEQAFTDLGFMFGAPDLSDPLFRPACLPEGWTREGSEHAMWSYVLDERGIRRVAVFYKAAFYDCRAFMSLLNVGAELAGEVVWGEPSERPDDATWALRRLSSLR